MGARDTIETAQGILYEALIYTREGTSDWAELEGAMVRLDPAAGPSLIAQALALHADMRANPAEYHAQARQAVA